jgi:hypothetical protein
METGGRKEWRLVRPLFPYWIAEAPCQAPHLPRGPASDGVHPDADVGGGIVHDHHAERLPCPDSFTGGDARPRALEAALAIATAPGLGHDLFLGHVQPEPAEGRGWSPTAGGHRQHEPGERTKETHGRTGPRLGPAVCHPEGEVGRGRVEGFDGCRGVGAVDGQERFQSHELGAG